MSYVYNEELFIYLQLWVCVKFFFKKEILINHYSYTFINDLSQLVATSVKLFHIPMPNLS